MIVCFGPSPTIQRTMIFSQLQTGAVNRCTHMRQYASGKAINAARVVHTLGEPVLACGVIGGSHARLIQEDLDAAGISHDYEDTGPQTRLCVTVVDERNRNATELVEEAAPLQHSTYDCMYRRTVNRLEGAKAIVMGGSLPGGMPETVYGDLVKESIARGVRTIIDARGTPLLRAAEAGAFVCKPNRGELARTLDVSIASQSQLIDAMRSLIERGCRWVVVTQGPGPTMLTDGEGVWQVGVPHIDATSPIGSGDAFAGGLAVGLVRGMDVPDAAKLASACAVANAMTPYAGHVDLDTLPGLIEQVRVNRLD